MADIHYISIDEARDIHLATIRNSGGGDCGELDIGKLESVLCHIQNDNYYPTFLDKLLHLFIVLVKFHLLLPMVNKWIAIYFKQAMFLA